MGLRVCHISDTHGSKFHSQLMIPECELLIHSGDIGGRTGLLELEEFLRWFEKQPAKKKIFIPGNHDLCLDKKFLDKQVSKGVIGKQVAEDLFNDAMEAIKRYDVTYLCDESCSYSGYEIFGSAVTPSFHKEYWAFNADRGDEIKKCWELIPSNTNILITHGPPYGIFDAIPENFKATPDEDLHRGCKDLLDVIKDRLDNLELHCFGHIHDGPTGICVAPSWGRPLTTFSNGAVLDNGYKLIMSKPPIINI